MKLVIAAMPVLAFAGLAAVIGLANCATWTTTAWTLLAVSLTAFVAFFACMTACIIDLARS